MLTSMWPSIILWYNASIIPVIHNLKYSNLSKATLIIKLTSCILLDTTRQGGPRLSYKTSMHSSRMRTARLLTVSRSVRGGRGCLPGGRCLGVSAQGGCLPRGCLPGGRVSASGGGGVCLGGCLSGGCLPKEYLPRCMLVYTLPVNRITDRCKNIILPQTSFAGGNTLHLTFIIVNYTKPTYLHVHEKHYRVPKSCFNAGIGIDMHVNTSEYKTVYSCNRVPTFSD